MNPEDQPRETVQDEIDYAVQLDRLIEEVTVPPEYGHSSSISSDGGERFALRATHDRRFCTT